MTEFMIPRAPWVVRGHQHHCTPYQEAGHHQSGHNDAFGRRDLQPKTGYEQFVSIPYKDDDNGTQMEAVKMKVLAMN